MWKKKEGSGEKGRETQRVYCSVSENRDIELAVVCSVSEKSNSRSVNHNTEEHCYKYERLHPTDSLAMEDFAQYKAQARADLTRDSNLDKASDLVAKRNVLLADPNIPDALKRAQLKQLNRQVWTWRKKVRQPFDVSPVPQVGQDTATDPTKALVHALVKQLKDEPKEESLETKTPANVKPPKPTPTPRRPLPKIPATPLSGVTTLPETKKFDRILGKSEKQFDLIKQKYDRLTNPYKDQGSSESGPPPKKKKKEKETLGKAVKRGLKKGLEEGAKQWLDF